VFFGLRAEAQFVNMVDDLAQVVAAGNLVSKAYGDVSGLTLLANPA
jgi:hypothetical protein